jgi:hypothetical protein
MVDKAKEQGFPEMRAHFPRHYPTVGILLVLYDAARKAYHKRALKSLDEGHMVLST